MRYFTTIALLLLLDAPVEAQEELAPYFNVDEHGLWVEGYDPVAYFVDKKALKGEPEFAVTSHGATFRFATRTHMDLFRLQPEKYLPEYGGYCAYALGANNEKVEVDPATFKMIDGRVFLFYNAFFNNTLMTWNKDEARLRRSADEHWAAFKHAQ